jgi:hypothetical protein
LARRVFEQIRHESVDIIVDNRVIVVENQKYFLVDIGKLADESGDDGVGRSQGEIGNQPDHRLTGAATSALQGLRDVAQESTGVIVVRFKSQPSDGMPLVDELVRKSDGQRGLAETRSSFNECELLRLDLTDEIEQSRPFYETRQRACQPDLGGEKQLLLASYHVSSPPTG